MKCLSILLSLLIASPSWAVDLRLGNYVSQFSNNLSGGAAGQVPYQTGANATSFSNATLANSVFCSASAGGAPAWCNNPTLAGTLTLNNGANIVNGQSLNWGVGTTLLYGDATSAYLKFRTGGSDRAAIDSTGAMGIGVTTNLANGTLVVVSTSTLTNTAIIRAVKNDGTTTVLSATQAGTVGIGTSIPQNALDVNGSVAVGSYAGGTIIPSGYIISDSIGVGTNIVPSNVALMIKGHAEVTGTNPTATNCNGVATGSDNAFKITIGGGGATGCNVAFATAYTNIPICVSEDESSVVTIKPITSTTAVVLNATLLANDNVDVICIGRR